MHDESFEQGLRAKPTPEPIPPEPEPQPLPEPAILVHRCNLAHQGNATDYRCDCHERITQAEADALIENGEAEYLTTTRAGKPYVRRSSIVLWQTREQLEKLAAEKIEREKEAAKQQDIAEVVTAFRQTRPTDERTDQEIIEAFKSIADKADQVFFDFALAYWDVLLKHAGWPMSRGSFIQGHGELVTGGYDAKKIGEVVAAHERAESTGGRRCKPTGHGADDFEIDETNETKAARQARRILLKWREEAAAEKAEGKIKFRNES